MRKFLDGLYLACGVAAAGFMIAIAGLILVAIGGGIFGYITRSLDEFAGYAMAASAFLAFAYTFGANEHIRVTLVIERFTGKARRVMELVCHALGAFFAGYFAWYSVRMTYVSWQLNDVSQGLVPVPLWIPQLGMAVGTTVFAIAVLDRFVALLRGAPLPGAGGGVMADR